MKKITVMLFAMLMSSLLANAREPHRGYRGFFDVNNSIWFLTDDEEGDEGWIGTAYYFGLSTSHGYQFNRWLFIGGGLDINVSPQLADCNLSPFAEGRFDLRFGKFTPYGDFRLGYNLTNGGGMYISPTVGYRFDWGRRVCLNFGLGLSMVGVGYDKFDITQIPDGNGDYMTEWKYVGKGHRFQNFLTIRLGIEF